MENDFYTRGYASSRQIAGRSEDREPDLVINTISDVWSYLSSDKTGCYNLPNGAGVVQWSMIPSSSEAAQSRTVRFFHFLTLLTRKSFLAFLHCSLPPLIVLLICPRLLRFFLLTPLKQVGIDHTPEVLDKLTTFLQQISKLFATAKTTDLRDDISHHEILQIRHISTHCRFGLVHPAD